MSQKGHVTRELIQKMEVFGSAIEDIFMKEKRDIIHVIYPTLCQTVIVAYILIRWLCQ